MTSNRTPRGQVRSKVYAALKQYPLITMSVDDLLDKLPEMDRSQITNAVNGMLGGQSVSLDFGIQRVAYGMYRYDPALIRNGVPAAPEPVVAAPPALLELIMEGKDGTLLYRGDNGDLYRAEKL